MRGFLLLAVIAGLAWLFLVQKQSEKSSAPAGPAQSVSVKSTPEPLTPAPRGQASKYNYMKRALDRAADVRDQARARTQDEQNP